MFTPSKFSVMTCEEMRKRVKKANSKEGIIEKLTQYIKTYNDWVTYSALLTSWETSNKKMNDIAATEGENLDSVPQITGEGSTIVEYDNHIAKYDNHNVKLHCTQKPLPPLAFIENPSEHKKILSIINLYNNILTTLYEEKVWQQCILACDEVEYKVYREIENIFRALGYIVITSGYLKKMSDSAASGYVISCNIKINLFAEVVPLCYYD
jgi:hypothetical protein